MARTSVQKNYFQFTQGKITEASPLTFPENSMKDELNIEINFDGSIRRRLGINIENNYVEGMGTAFNVDPSVETTGGPAAQTYLWENVGGYPLEAPVLVVRYGNQFALYDAYREPLSAALIHTFEIDPAANTKSKLGIVEAKGYLFVAGDGFDPFYVKYDGGKFTVESITIYVRDLEGVDDGLDHFERPTTLTGEHRYNLLNQGWPYGRTDTNSSPGGNRPRRYADSPVAFRSALSIQGISPLVYPSNSDILSFYTDTGDSKGQIITPYVSDSDKMTTIAPKGKVIIEAFRENRRELAQKYSKVSSPVTPWLSPNFEERSTQRRPTCVEFFGGHIVYAGVNDLEYNDKIYFSQSLVSLDRAGKCYQVNDPTSDIDSSPLDTDGGVVRIESVDTVLALVSVGPSLAVIANNGVWSITSNDGTFSMDNVQVSKVSNAGAISSSSVIEYEGAVFYWSESGIYVIQLDTQFNTFNVTNISEETIQRDYLKISDTKKEFATAIADPQSRKIYWLYNNISGDNVTCRYNRALVFDVRTSAFYDFEFYNDETTPFVVGGFTKPGFTTSVFTGNVVVDSDNVVVGTDNVIAQSFSIVDDQTGSIVKFVTFFPPVANDITGTEQYNIAFSELNDRQFADWAYSGSDEGGPGFSFDSYVETGYELLGDTMRDKQAPYIFCYFDRTEESFRLLSDGWEFDYPSSCYMRALWDWTGSASPNRWSSREQVYRFRREYVVDPMNPVFDYGFDVIETKNKVRGKGKSLSLRFESEPRKDFRLLGWAISYTAETTP